MRRQMRGITRISPAARTWASSRSVIALVAAALALYAALATGCSSKDSATAPPPATGPSFNFTFPTAGQSVQYTFPDAGSFAYHCATHVGMNGTVSVSAAATTDSALVDVGYSNTLTFSPTTVTILPGGHVRWQREIGNITGTHSVTRP